MFGYRREERKTWLTLKYVDGRFNKDWEDPVGNNYFVTYVADYAPYEAGEKKNQSTQTEHPPSRFWFETRDKDNVVIADLSMLESAVEHAIPIGGGNLVVPH